MDDKYKLLRDNLHILVAEDEREGRGNQTTKLIVELLEERDLLVTAARVTERQDVPFKDLPLCDIPLRAEERIRLDENLKSMLAFLSAPGDWGYETKLGRLAVVLGALRREIWISPVREEADGGAV